jgi:hypothetical protein
MLFHEDIRYHAIRNLTEINFMNFVYSSNKMPDDELSDLYQNRTLKNRK